jgi:hypothetical protein
MGEKENNKGWKGAAGATRPRTKEIGCVVLAGIHFTVLTVRSIGQSWLGRGTEF